MARMEQVLSCSEVGWTIVRPPRLTDQPDTGRYRTAVNHHLRRGRTISAPTSPPRCCTCSMTARHLCHGRCGVLTLSLAKRLRLRTFQASGMTLFRRLTLVIRDGLIEHAFYPIFPRTSTRSRSLPGCTRIRPGAHDMGVQMPTSQPSRCPYRHGVHPHRSGGAVPDHELYSSPGPTLSRRSCPGSGWGSCSPSPTSSE